MCDEAVHECLAAWKLLIKSFIFKTVHLDKINLDSDNKLDEDDPDAL